MKKLTVGGLFNGIGSGLLGAEWAGFKPGWLVEYRDNYNKQTVDFNFPNIEVNLEAFQMQYGAHFIQLPKIDLIISSPDCKMFSNLGTKRKDRGKLEMTNWDSIQLFQALQIIVRNKPRTFIVENVPNALQYIKVEENRIIMPRFAEHEGALIPGYDFKEYKLQVVKLDSYDFTVPQHRKRIYIIGIKKEFYHYSWDEFNDVYNADAADLDTRILWDALTKEYRVGHTVVQAFAGIDYTTDIIPNHSEKRIKGFKKLKVGESYYGTQNNKRLDLEKPAGTIASHCSRFVHPSEPRVLTVKETARLMGFPDSFEFFGTETNQLDQIGKAIVPQVVLGLAFYIRQQLISSDG